MAERSRFWNGNPGPGDGAEAPYDAPTEFAEVMMAMTGAGRSVHKSLVFDGLAPTTTGTVGQLSIGAGRAQVYGTWYENDAAVLFSIPPAATAPRNDLVVLRKDWATQTVRLALKSGAEGGSAPALTQTPGVLWEAPVTIINQNPIAVPAGLISIIDIRESPTSLVIQKNILVNGNFRVWQRGLGPYSNANGNTYAWGPDMWYVHPNNPGTDTITVRWEGAQALPPSDQAVRIDKAGTTGSGMFVQSLKDRYPELRGRPMVFTAWVKADVANSVRLICFGGATPSYGPVSNFHPGDGQWRRLVMRFSIPSNATSCTVGFMQDQPGTYFADHATLALGESPFDEMYEDLPTEFIRCQAYFEVWGGNNSSSPGTTNRFLGMGNAYSANGLAVPVLFNVPKVMTPVIISSGTFSAYQADGTVGHPVGSVGAGMATFNSCQVTGMAGGPVFAVGQGIRCYCDSSQFLGVELRPM